MIVKDSGYGAQMFDCTSKIKELEEQLAAAREAKQALAAKMTAFYTEEVGGVYVEHGETGQLGRLLHVFTKNGEFFVHAWFLEVTAKSKLLKKRVNIPLYGETMGMLEKLTEAEYRDAFFHYVDGSIRTVESDGEQEV